MRATETDEEIPAGAFPRSVEDAERDAERIAAIARAAAGLMLATGLTIALAFAPEAERQIIFPRLLLAMSVMGGFLIVAAISFAASRATHYRPWLAYLLVACDALLIAAALQEGLRLSAHPGPYVFAQPGIWLIPIAIAIQAIRFRAGPLVFAAVLFVVVVGSLVLAGGVGSLPPQRGDELIALFTVPPDAIRSLMLVISTAVLVVSVRSKREILLRGLRTARREAEMQRFLPAEVTEKLGASASEEALAGQSVLAILFIDLVGFTRASEQVEPATVAGWLAEFRDRMNALIRAHGGFVDKFIGDGIMAIFGYESDPETAARQAVAVAEEIPAAMADWRAANPSAPDFRAAVGGAMGPVFVGVVGAGDRREFTVVGDAVNVASRLEGFAKDRNALAALGFELADRAGLSERFEATAEDLAVRGRREPMRVCLIPRT